MAKPRTLRLNPKLNYQNSVKIGDRVFVAHVANCDACTGCEIYNGGHRACNSIQCGSWEREDKLNVVFIEE